MRTLVEWLGLALIALGLGLWSLPGGLVAAGVLLVLEVNYGGPLELSRSRDDEGADGAAAP